MGSELNNKIGSNVREIRKKRGLTLGDVVEKLSTPITPQMLAVYEVGKSRWPADTLFEVARVLGVSIQELGK